MFNKIDPNSVKPQEGNTELRRGVTPDSVETRRVDIQCMVCMTYKIESEFYVKDRGTGRRDKCCKACRIVKTREHTLGVTQDDYIEMHKKQNGRCGICKHRLRSKRYKAFAVDHDHSTGRIRGLLCNNCNTGLGLFHDNPSYLRDAINWVKV